MNRKFLTSTVVIHAGACLFAVVSVGAGLPIVEGLAQVHRKATVQATQGVRVTRAIRSENAGDRARSKALLSTFADATPAVLASRLPIDGENLSEPHTDFRDGTLLEAARLKIE